MKQNLTFATLWPDDNDFASIVHSHWHKFIQPDPLYYYLVGIYIGIVGILAVMGNSLVITLFLLCKQLRTPPNMLIVNLAISDFSFALINGFPLKTIAAFNHRWGWGKLACELYGFAGSIFGFISLTTMAFIALDRYLVIVQPFETFSRITYGKVIVMIFITWIWSALWSIPPFFGYSNFLILIFVIRDKKADIEAAKTSIILVLLYLMSWSPYAIVCLMTLIGSRDSLTPFHSELPVLFAKTSAVYNPIVYAVKHPKFRMEIEKRFPFLICCCPPKPKERLQNTIVSKIQVSQIGIGTVSGGNENTLNTVKRED
ncbi:putative opsin-like receptor [Schistosoma mansoni]|uniref:putative opsin-like receptor n=1 Tax=Schistosoma mansoni TaxID=6183 RepID=UPI00022DC9CE|nr:putative opsin-like receptor [Schistosoma mansoni]|eukprot:XP_018655263.1 putative opsin-like receptor [Schistosoma mansoni]